MFSILFSGDHGARAIPVPIPNTEVKTRSGDGTASLGGGRVARCRIFSFKPVRFRGLALFLPGRRGINAQCGMQNAKEMQCIGGRCRIGGAASIRAIRFGAVECRITLASVHLSRGGR